MKDSRKKMIADYVNRFFYEHDKVPSVREIEKGTGIPLATVHRCLIAMKEAGELSYNGYRSVRTKSKLSLLQKRNFKNKLLPIAPARSCMMNIRLCQRKSSRSSMNPTAKP